MNCFTKCNFLYLILAGTARYLVNVIICIFLDHTPGSHCCWHDGSFKVLHFFSFYFQVFAFTLLYLLTHMLLSAGTDISIRRHVFSFIVLNYHIWSIALYFSVHTLWDFHTIIILSLESFSHQQTLMNFHWSLSDSKSPQVSRTLLSIVADLNNAVVWTVFTHPVISKSYSPCTYPLVNVPRTPITIGIIITFMFHSFFNSLARFRYLSLFSLSFNFTQWSAGTAKSTILQVLSFSLITIRSGRLVEIKWSVCISKSQWSLCLILQDRFRVVYILFVCMVKFKFLAQSPVDHLAHPKSCLVLYSFFANLLHLLIMWLIVLSRSLHNLHLLFIIYSLRVFHISISWWSFTGVWVTASILKSPGLFTVFWLFSIML